MKDWFLGLGTVTRCGEKLRYFTKIREVKEKALVVGMVDKTRRIEGVRKGDIGYGSC